MSPPERFPPDDPREWMNRARSNLAPTKHRILGTHLEDTCFDAQQAAEMATKAVMISREIAFSYLHDLGSLLFLLEEAGETVPEAIRTAVSLTTYTSTTRYPNAGIPVTKQGYGEAVAVAGAVVRWAEERL